MAFRDRMHAQSLEGRRRTASAPYSVRVTSRTRRDRAVALVTIKQVEPISGGTSKWVGKPEPKSFWILPAEMLAHSIWYDMRNPDGLRQP